MFKTILKTLLATLIILIILLSLDFYESPYSIYELDKFFKLPDTDVVLVIMACCFVIIDFSLRKFIIFSIPTAILFIYPIIYYSYMENKNIYNGLYVADTNKITSKKILSDVKNYQDNSTKELFRLYINGYSASLYGYYKGYKVKAPNYNICITDKTLTLSNFSFAEQYCQKNTSKDMLVLRFEVDKNDKNKLFCKGCRENGFVNYWKKVK